MESSELFQRGDDHCKHTWSEEGSERHGDMFIWSRVCKNCGEKRTTRSLFRGPGIEIHDWISGISYLIGSDVNLAKQEFRFLNCICGNTVRVDFDLAENGRVVRKSAVTCDCCGEGYSAGSQGPDHRPRGAFWVDSPEIE